MITLEEYAGKWLDHADFTQECKDKAEVLLRQVCLLLAAAERSGIDIKKNPVTDSLVSGTQYGGFRPQSCPIGASKSSHKTGEAVDIYDPTGKIDDWINDAILTQYNLYRESPAYTKGWCHLSTKPPKSGKRTFIP